MNRCSADEVYALQGAPLRDSGFQHLRTEAPRYVFLPMN